jgi:ZIP family zinc transporter
VSNAFLAGLVAGSAFVVGGVIAHRVRISAAALGLLTGFGAGALIGAVAYELVDTAGDVAGRPISVAAGLIVGSGLHLVATGSTARHLRSVEGEHSALSVGRHLVADVVPEAIVVVGGLVSHHHISAAVITAVFLCGIPESIFATTRLAELGVRPRTVMTSWVGLTLLSGATAAVAYRALDDAADGTLAFVLAAAGGAVLTNITTELIPEGYELVGRTLGMALVVGFAIVFALAEFS